LETCETFCSPKYERSAGNGFIMCLVQVPIFYFSTPEDAILMQEIVQTKHAHILTVDTCKCIAGLIIGAILGHSKEKILSHRYCPVSG